MAVSRHLGLEPEIRAVNVYRGEGRSAEYLAINPSGKIPTMVEGGLTLTESNAILVYIAEAHGGERLLPRAPAARAPVFGWLFWEASQWQPALTGVLAPRVGHALLPDTVPAPEQPPDWEDAALRPLLDHVESRLAATPYLAGDALTLADFSVAGMTTYFRCCDFPERDFPALRDWLARIGRLPAWRETATELWG